MLITTDNDQLVIKHTVKIPTHSLIDTVQSIYMLISIMKESSLIAGYSWGVYIGNIHFIITEHDSNR